MPASFLENPAFHPRSGVFALTYSKGASQPPLVRGIAGASPIALLRYLANHGSDRLLIIRRHRCDHRGDLGAGRVLVQPNRVFLEDLIGSFLICGPDLQAAIRDLRRASR
jgi:hypothetical protein